MTNCQQKKAKIKSQNKDNYIWQHMKENKVLQNKSG